MKKRYGRWGSWIFNKNSDKTRNDYCFEYDSKRNTISQVYKDGTVIDCSWVYLGRYHKDGDLSFWGYSEIKEDGPKYSFTTTFLPSHIYPNKKYVQGFLNLGYKIVAFRNVLEGDKYIPKNGSTIVECNEKCWDNQPRFIVKKINVDNGDWWA